MAKPACMNMARKPQKGVPVKSVRILFWRSFPFVESIGAKNTDYLCGCII
jgi:hypothetical protein